MKVTAILKGGKDQLDRRAIYIRSSHLGKQEFEATQMKVTDDQFEKGKVKNHPQAQLFNQNIRTLIAKTEVRHSQGQARNKYPDADLFFYVEDKLPEWEKEKAPETIRQYNSELNKVRDYWGPRLLLSQISPEWLRKYKAHCYNKLGNETNTVWKSFKFLRKVIRLAVRESVIERNPFDVFEMPQYIDPQKVYLTREQVDAIEAFTKDPDCPADLVHAGTWFVIGCWTGLRFKDMAGFNRGSIKGGRIVTYTHKTKETVSMSFEAHLQELFERIDYEPMRYTNTHFNRLLKAIATYCGIEETLTVHISRHTFAVMAAAAGISIEVVGKLLGHRNLKTTNIYFKIANPRIDEELKRMR